MNFRPIDWNRDSAAMRSLDTSFTTDRVYSLRQAGLSFSFVEASLTQTKRYDVVATQESIASSLTTVAACEGDILCGFAIVKEESWHRRAVITDFYLDPQWRRRGIGRKMMSEIFHRIAEAPVRDLWVETQNVNLPAVKFYQSMGLEICGFDSRMYDGVLSGEVAMYLSKDLQKTEPNPVARANALTLP